MKRPPDALKFVLARDIEGRTELIEMYLHADTLWLVTEDEEVVVEPDKRHQILDDLTARGFVEVSPTDRRKLEAEAVLVAALVREAFRGVTLGNGVGLHQAQGLDDYADESTLASLHARDEKNDWSAIPVDQLDRCYSSLAFFDAEGMRFHLPAYLIADLAHSLKTACVLFHLVGSCQDFFDMLSPAQREAVREYLWLQLSDNACSFEHPLIEEALLNYWMTEG